MAKRSRDKMITFWVTEDELAKINANMEKLGTSNLSAYLRKMAITGLIVQLDIPELKQIVSLMPHECKHQPDGQAHQSGGYGCRTASRRFARAAGGNLGGHSRSASTAEYAAI